MIKRLTWFVGGAVAGAASAGVAKRKVKAVAADLTPVNIARRVTGRVRDAVHEGRAAMHHRETELRARFDHRAEPLSEHLSDGDEVLVDGVPVEPGQVIVLGQVRERKASEAERTASPRRHRS